MRPSRYRDNERLDLSGRDEPWVDLSHRHERSNHQARDDQQCHRQRDLPHDERIARAMPGRTRRSPIGRLP